MKRLKFPHWSTLAVILIAAVLFLAAFYTHRERGAVPTAGEITNWGLSFQKEGEPPVANATGEYLSQFDSVYCMPSEGKTIYITFDAGFENGNTEAILEALKKHGVKATFFLVGNYLETEPELVQRMVSEAYKKITGEDMPKLYRPPQGKFCESNLKMAKELGYRTVFWSLAYVDWYENDQPTHQQAFDKLIPRVHPGAVVLLHSTSRTNGEILDELLTKWEELGYRFGGLWKDLQ